MPDSPAWPIALVLCLAGCGAGPAADGATSDGSGVPDSPVRDAPAVPDAPDDPSDAGSNICAAPVWSQVVASTTSDPLAVSFLWAVSDDDGVVVVARPELVRYAADGDELVRRSAPAGAFLWSNGALSTSDGRLLVLYQDSAANNYVQEYSQADLSVGQRTELPSDSVTRGAIADTSSGVFHLTARSEAGAWFLDLRRLESGVVSETTSIPVAAEYLIRGVGSEVSTGEVVFCAIRHDGGGVRHAELLRLTPGSASMAALRMSTSTSVVPVPCSLAVTPSGLAAVWEEWESGTPHISGAVITADGQALLGEPVGLGQTTGAISGGIAASENIVLNHRS